MASQILIYKKDKIEIYTIQGIPKDKNNPSLNSLEKIKVLIQQFQINQDIPPAVEIFLVENPPISIIKEAHLFFKQLIQMKIAEGYIAINLSNWYKKKKEFTDARYFSDADKFK